MSKTTELSIQEEGIETPTETVYDCGVGALLSEARIAQGLSWEVVAESLKISVAYVQALETGDYKFLPGAAFVRGYMRSYARLLELDEDRVLSICQGEVTVDDHVVSRILKEKPLQPLNPPGHHGLAILFGVIVSVFVLGSIFWWSGRDDSIAAPVSEQSGILLEGGELLPVESVIAPAGGDATSSP